MVRVIERNNSFLFGLDFFHDLVPGIFLVTGETFLNDGTFSVKKTVREFPVFGLGGDFVDSAVGIVVVFEESHDGEPFDIVFVSKDFNVLADHFPNYIFGDVVVKVIVD